MRDASADDAAYVGLSTIGGVLVEDVGAADSPARRAGVQPGDVIIAVDGHPVDYVAQLQEAIAFRKPGDVVSLEVARKGGARVTLRVPLENVGGEQVASADHRGRITTNASGDHAAAPLLGVTVAPTDESAVSQLQLPDDVRGVIVTSVDDNSPAAGRLAQRRPGRPGHHPVRRRHARADAGGAARRHCTRRRTRAADGGAPIVTLRVYNVPSKTRRIERVRLATTTGN